MKLILFDIDGTILDTGRVGFRAINDVMRRRYGVSCAMEGVEAAGRTDPAILRDIFRINLGREISKKEAEEVFEEYTTTLRVIIQKSKNSTIMPGVRELLTVLSTTSGYVMGIATGNIQAAALIKLSHHGLDSFFPFGGFGSDSEDRSEVIRIAIERGKGHLKGQAKYERVIVVGDTHHDILCARAAGAKVVAVATGIHSQEELRRYNPDHLLPDLSDTDNVLAALSS
ncbi:MAG: HAD family hydrolase [Candidatus Caldarchaeum sp.]